MHEASLVMQEHFGNRPKSAFRLRVVCVEDGEIGWVDPETELVVQRMPPSRFNSGTTQRQAAPALEVSKMDFPPTDLWWENGFGYQKVIVEPWAAAIDRLFAKPEPEEPAPSKLPSNGDMDALLAAAATRAGGYSFLKLTHIRELMAKSYQLGFEDGDRMRVRVTPDGTFIHELEDGTSVPSTPPRKLAIEPTTSAPASPTPAPPAKVQEHHVADPTSNTVTSAATATFGRAKAALGAEVPEALWRLSARKAIERTPPVLLKALVKSKIITPAVSKQIAAFLATEHGSGIYAIVVGTLMTAHPRATKKPWLGTLASQIRMEGLVRVGSTIVDPVFDAIEAVVNGLFKDIEDNLEPPELPDAEDHRASFPPHVGSGIDVGELHKSVHVVSAAMRSKESFG